MLRDIGSRRRLGFSRIQILPILRRRSGKAQAIPTELSLSEDLFSGIALIDVFPATRPV
jgi:hypothetical protein